MSEVAETAAPTENGSVENIQPYVLDELGDDFDPHTLSAEQLERALDAPDKVGGLRGLELRTYVLEGPEVRKAQRAKRKADKAKSKRGGKGGTRAIARGYEPWVADAVSASKALIAKKQMYQDDPDKHVAAAGPVNHVKVRAVVTRKLEEQNLPVTADNVLGLVEGTSLAQLKKIAMFQTDKPSLRPLRALGAEFEDDGWCRNRYLASILVPWVEELRKEEKASA